MTGEIIKLMLQKASRQQLVLQTDLLASLLPKITQQIYLVITAIF
jgi:hypothetical protein